jgi:4-amino-4-deoxy-L-arabinose transferase-like glycosyltransferase
MSKCASILPNANGKSPIYGKLMWIILLAFAARVAVRLHSGGADFWQNGYTFFFQLAQNIATGNGISIGGDLPTAFRVPLYPMFLAAVTLGHQAFVPVLLAQSLIGAGTVLCAALIARELFGNAAAIIAAILAAIYPYYVVHDTALQETGLYTFLSALSVVILMRVRRNASAAMAVCAGLTLGAAVLTRANLALFAVLAPLWLIVRTGANVAPWHRRFWACILCTGALALTVSLWLERSYRLIGSPTLTTENGISLWAGNNAHTFSHYPNGSIDRSVGLAFKALSPTDRAEIEALEPNEVAVDQWFLRKGLDYMREDPWRTISNGVRKISAAFCVLPSPRRNLWPSMAYFLSYGPVMTIGLWGMWTGRRNWREHLIFYMLFGTFVAVAAIYFGHTSHRAYLDVYWIVFAAGVLAASLSKSRYRGLLEPAWQRVSDVGGRPIVSSIRSAAGDAVRGLVR